MKLFTLIFLLLSSLSFVFGQSPISSNTNSNTNAISSFSEFEKILAKNLEEFYRIKSPEEERCQKIANDLLSLFDNMDFVKIVVAPDDSPYFSSQSSSTSAVYYAPETFAWTRTEGKVKWILYERIAVKQSIVDKYNDVTLEYILKHELIHAFLVRNGEIEQSKAHGEPFKAKARELGIDETGIPSEVLSAGYSRSLLAWEWFVSAVEWLAIFVTGSLIGALLFLVIPPTFEFIKKHKSAITSIDRRYLLFIPFLLGVGLFSAGVYRIVSSLTVDRSTRQWSAIRKVIKTKTITVSGKDRWKDSGFIPSSTGHVHISPSGTVTWSPSNGKGYGTVPPAGEKLKPGDFSDGANFVSFDAPCGGLLMRAGDKIFFVGNGGEFEVPADKPLEFMVNDRMNSLKDNSGSFTVRIEEMRWERQ